MAASTAELWKEAVLNFVKGEDDSAVDVISNEILNGQLKLVDLVDSLEVELTSPDIQSRSRGTSLLSEVLKRLPHNFLNDSEVSVLVAFMCDRLQDHHSIQPHALQALLALSICVNMPVSCAVKIAKSIFKEVQTQMLAQPVRRAVFSTLDNLLTNTAQCQALQSLGAEFVFGYIQTIDGEKDPRNLITAFHSVFIIIKHFPIGTFAEDLFEVIACYFPIDFTPKDEDPQSVKQSDLVEGLRRCLAATPKFAQFCLPLLQEKLNSDIQSAKTDSLYTLSECASVYGPGPLMEYAGSLWSIIRRLVFSSEPNSELAKGSLKALSSIVTTLSQEIVEKSTSELSVFLKDSVIKDCQRYLASPEQNLLVPSCHLLMSAASASPAACCLVLPLVMKTLHEQFHKQQQAKERQAILEGLLGFIRVADKGKLDEDMNPLLEHVSILEALFTSVLLETSSALRKVSIRGLASLNHYYKDEKRPLVVDTLTRIIISDPDAEVRQESISCLAVMATESSQVIVDTTLPQLLKHVATESMEVDGENNVDKCNILHALASLSVHHSIYSVTLPAFIKHLRTSFKNSNEDTEVEVTARSILDVVSSCTKTQAGLLYANQHVLPHLLELYLQDEGNGDGDSRSHILENSIVKTVAFTISKIVQSLDIRQSEEVVNTVVEKVLVRKVTENQSISLRELDNKLKILTAVVCSTGSKITKLADLLKHLLDISVDDSKSDVTETSAKCFSGLINKMAKGPDLESTIGDTACRLEKVIDGSTCSAEQQQCALTCWTWVCKALVLRGHPVAHKFTEKILNMLSNSVLSTPAADSLYVILHEYDDIMTREMHANIRMMYRQRFFQEIAPQVISKFNDAEKEMKSPYLKALSHMLHHAPKQVLNSHLPSMLPLLIQSLSTEDSTLILNTMETLHGLIEENAAIIGPYTDSLIPRLLSLSKFKGQMSVRRSALKTLGSMTTLPHHLLYPHVTEVIRSLAEAVDDHKRLVRREAVSTRCEWFLVGSPK